MNISKLLSVFVSILAIVMVAGFASAESNLTFSSSSPSVIYIGSNSAVNFTLNNNGAQDMSVSFTYSPSDSAFSLAFQPLTIPAGSSRNTLVTASGNSGVKFGSYSASISARDGLGNNATRNVEVIKSFCSAGPVGTNLTISSFSINSDGSEDEEWKPLDTIEVEVEVENIGDSRVNDVVVELGLFDAAGNNVVNRLDFINADDRKIELGDLRDGDNEVATFEFTVPADFNLDDSDYKLAVKAYSKSHENQICIDNEDSELDSGFYQSISVNYEDEEDRFIAISDLQIPSEAVCGEVVRGSFKVVNIGEDDQEQILVRLTNANIGLSEEFEIRDNLDSGDTSQLIDFSFTVPSTVRDGSYPLTFRSSYDYRNGIYRHDGDSTSPASLKVIGCGTSQPTTTPSSDVVITANVGSPTPGQTFDVRVTLRNRGTQSVNLQLDASGFQSWGQLDGISDDSFSLDAGQSKTVTFTFKADETASGPESFTVEARSASGIETQDVEVQFPEKQSSNGFSLSGNKPLLWVIGAINVVLIVLIVVVAIRLARK